MVGFVNQIKDPQAPRNPFNFNRNTNVQLALSRIFIAYMAAQQKLTGKRK